MKCLQCGMEIKPNGGVTTGTKLFVGLVGFSGGVVGFVWGYPAGTASEALGYYGNKKNIMSIEKKVIRI